MEPGNVSKRPFPMREMCFKERDNSELLITYRHTQQLSQELCLETP